MTAKIVVGSTTLPEKAGYWRVWVGPEASAKISLPDRQGPFSHGCRQALRAPRSRHPPCRRTIPRSSCCNTARPSGQGTARTYASCRTSRRKRQPYSRTRLAIAGRLDSHFPMKYRAGAASARLLWDEAPATVILGRPESVRLQQWAGGMPEGGEEAVGSGRSAAERGRPQDHLGGRGYHGLTGFGASAGRNDIVNSSCAPIGECYSLAKTPVDRANWSSSMAKDISTDDVGSLASGFGQSASRFIGG